MPPETVFARPRANTIIASVAMKGWMRNARHQPARDRAARRRRPAASPAPTSHDRPRPVERGEREEHRGEREHAADGEVDAAGDDHQRHAAGEDAVDRRLAQRVAVHRRLPERAVGVEHGADREARAPAPAPRGRSGGRRAKRRSEPSEAAGARAVARARRSLPRRLHSCVAHRRLEHRVRRRLAAREPSGDAAAVQHDDAIGEREQLGQIGAGDQDARCRAR